MRGAVGQSGAGRLILGRDAGYGTSLPSAPRDGDEFNLVVDATNGVVWRFRYNAGSASAYKWEFLGGPPLYAEIVTSESTTSSSYVALTTAGPSVTLPRAGDYDVLTGATAFKGGGAGNAHMSYDIGGTTAVDADAWDTDNAGWIVASRKRRKTALTAVALTAKYKNGTFKNRWIAVTPVRVS